MTTLDQIVDLDELETEIRAGYVNRRYHPEFPELALVGYSDKAQFDAHWTPTVRAARGLIYRTDTLEVLARPFAKFFNYGQGDAVYDLDAPILGAWDKVDGSLGIAYWRPDGRWAIATRGSFDSEQARHATAILHPNRVGALKGTTALFEIVYPENRIVVDYGDRDELVSLGFVDIDTGAYTPARPSTPGLDTLRGVLDVEPRPNAEGFVAWLDPFTAVKFKQADYLALHRIVSNLTPKEVWRQLRAGTFDAFAEALPDEFFLWAENEAASQRAGFEDAVGSIDDVYARLLATGLDTRKEQALWLRENASGFAGFVFSILDGRDYSDSLWRSLEPKGA